MKKIFFLLFFCFAKTFLFGQENVFKNPPFQFKNNLHIELAGHGLLYSVNYERLFFNEEKLKIYGHIGLSLYPESSGIIGLWVPISAQQLISFGKHHIELGIGQILTRENFREKENDFDSSPWDAFGSLHFGYRFQKPDGRFLFKIAFTPFFEYLPYLKSNSGGFTANRPSFFSSFYPSAGMAFGYNF